ncbi:hypothetical protein [Nocardia fluminea]|uniref:hypothetical protein n=1 Tax=Nocardia fluminea TaxID=134984 RepID=UPI0036649406
MPKHRKPRKPRPCRLCGVVRVNPNDPKITALSPFFRRFAGANPDIPIVMCTFDNSTGRRTNLRNGGIKSGSLHAADVCTPCRLRIANNVDLPAVNILESLAMLQDVTLDKETSAAVARWAIKTAHLLLASEPKFFTPKIAREINNYSDLTRPIWNNTLVCIGRFPSDAALGSRFRTFPAGGVENVVGLITCNNLVITAYAPHQTTQPAQTILHKYNSYWALHNQMQPIWPYMGPIHWPHSKLVDPDFILAAFQTLGTHHYAIDDPILDALKRAGLRDR